MLGLLLSGVPRNHTSLLLLDWLSAIHALQQHVVMSFACTCLLKVIATVSPSHISPVVTLRVISVSRVGGRTEVALSTSLLFLASCSLGRARGLALGT